MLVEQLEEVETAGSAIDHEDARGHGAGLDRPHRVDAHALVAHQKVADAEDEQSGYFPAGGSGRDARGTSMNFQPPTIEDVTPRPST